MSFYFYHALSGIDNRTFFPLVGKHCNEISPKQMQQHNLCYNYTSFFQLSWGGGGGGV